MTPINELFVAQLIVNSFLYGCIGGTYADITSYCIRILYFSGSGIFCTFRAVFVKALFETGSNNVDVSSV